MLNMKFILRVIETEFLIFKMIFHIIFFQKKKQTVKLIQNCIINVCVLNSDQYHKE